MTQEDALVERMRVQLHVWEDDEPYEDWWTYQREYGQAMLRLETQSAEITALREKVEKMREGLERIAEADTTDKSYPILNYAADTEEWRSQKSFGPCAKIARALLSPPLEEREGD